jgi:hypothetical protein
MTYEAVPLIPRSVLFADPRYTNPADLPDRHPAGLSRPRDGVLNMYVGPLEDPSAARPLTNDQLGSTPALWGESQRLAGVVVAAPFSHHGAGDAAPVH